MKKSKFLKIMVPCCIVIITIVGILSANYFIRYSFIKKNSSNMTATMKTLDETRLDYLFVDINPSFTIVMKEELVYSIICRNDDCKKIISEIEYKDKKIDYVLSNIYNIASDNGFDTTKGITVKTLSRNEKYIDKTEYIDINIIDKKTEDALNSKNYEEVETSLSKNEKILKELEKDKDYNKIYSCFITNDKLECYLKPELRIDYNTINLYQKRIAEVLNRFNIKTESVMEGIFEEPLFRLYINPIILLGFILL